MAQIYDLQQQLIQAETDAKDREAIAATAQQRAESITNPYDKTSRWEGWFPLDRPMKITTLPVLLAISIFLLVVSTGLFLRLANLELRFGFITESASFIGQNLRGVF